MLAIACRCRFRSRQAARPGRYPECGRAPDIPQDRRGAPVACSAISCPPITSESFASSSPELAHATFVLTGDNPVGSPSGEKCILSGMTDETPKTMSMRCARLSVRAADG